MCFEVFGHLRDNLAQADDLRGGKRRGGKRTPMANDLRGGKQSPPHAENWRKEVSKYIFVTGGVVSGLGKGITAASLGRLLKMRGLRVASQKLDPYMNVDPGTMR